MKEPIKALLERYLLSCSIMRNYSNFTIMGYRNTFKLLLKETKIKYPEELTKRKLEEWFFNGRLNRKWSASTFLHYHKHINMFFKWLVKENIVEINIAVDMEKPKLEYKLPRTLTKEEAVLILDASFHMKYTYRFERYRNRALVGVMLLAGLRRNETQNLMCNDVDFVNNSIFVRQGKGAKDRVVPVSSKLRLILEEYVDDRKRLNKSSMALFTAVQRDHAMGNKVISNLVSKLRKYVNIDFSAHTLRHGFARLMLEGGCDIYTLSKIMGHSKITTTTIYLSCSDKQMTKSIEMHVLNESKIY
ncbi:tyrosine-type recombinase/integrase [bacterium]|nr:tyrosine-type recombinase/integrase [bacterium]